MLRQHQQTGADLTIAVRRVSPHDVHRYGIVALGTDDVAEGYEEKPRRAREALANMGVYAFKKEVLISLLEKNDFVDFGRHLVPAMVEGALTCAPITSPATGPTSARSSPIGKPI